MKICINCNNDFTPKDSRQKFCSRSCGALFNNRAKEATCSVCSGAFVRDKSTNVGRYRKICNMCIKSNKDVRFAKIKQQTIEQYYSSLNWKAGHPQHRWNHIRKLCRSWNQELKKNGCQACGYQLHVEYCHIKPVASFPLTATLGEVNDPSNILILCRNHHWEQENGYLDVSSLK